MIDTAGITTALTDTAEAFKKMQIALLAFAALSGIAIIIISIALVKSK